MSQQGQDWAAQLAALPPEIHVLFRLRQGKYWIAEWYRDGKQSRCYIGITSPTTHRCFDQSCDHPQQKPRSRQAHTKPGPKPGYQPGEQTIQRLRASHVGKGFSEPHRQALRAAKQRRDQITGYVAPFRQIAEQLREQLHQGYWHVGQRLPTIVEAARQFGVDEATANKAYRELAGEGLVALRPGQGTFILRLDKAP